MFSLIRLADVWMHQFVESILELAHVSLLVPLAVTKEEPRKQNEFRAPCLATCLLTCQAEGCDIPLRGT